MAEKPIWQRDLERDAARYRWLRERDLETIEQGGIFAGQTPENFVLNGEDLDQRIDAEMQRRQTATERKTQC